MNMDGEEVKNRADVMAQRQQRKMTKQAAKTKDKKKDAADSKTNNNVEQKQKSIDNSRSEKSESSIAKNPQKETNVKISVEDVDKKTECAQNKQNDLTLKTEKSREEILAEREARKQAKLNAKMKTKGSSEKSIKSSEIPEVKSKESVEKNDADTNIGKSKAELRAERRAKQEAQRAAKEAQSRVKLEQTGNKIPQKDKQDEVDKPQKKKLDPVAKSDYQRVRLFSHLKFEQKKFEAKLTQNIHPEVVQLGIKYSSRIVMGSNARCIALLKALKGVIKDYITPSEKEFSRGLESQLSNVMVYLNKCRPSSVSMINSIRHIKSHLTQLPNDISDVEAKRKLYDVIDTFIKEQIDVAGEAICNTVQNKIANGDNILIYACSSLLYRILVESHKSGKQFTVIVVDSGPWFEGREMLRRLVDHGIKCSYVLVSALSFIMREVTKVLLGAHALLANGSVMSRAGSALVALVANSYNVPVLVCCETYKFCERVQMDAFVYNELGNTEDMDYSKGEGIKETISSVNTLSVLYDITPADLVTAVVTEVAILPCTSVPVILRIKPSDVVS